MFAANENPFELAQRVGRYLAQSQHPALRRVKIETSGGAVRVSGVVSSFYEKQLLQQCILRVAGPAAAIDDVQVARTPPPAADPWAESDLYHAWSDHAGLGT